jgi:hypothetical protein
VRSRWLSPGEKRDVAVAALDALKQQNPGCHIHVDVEDWTDDAGVPKWTARIEPRAAKEEE